ncbi:MAG: ABC transporter ATP-binding protein/permease [Clostridia bacterium]|nr:ABC transporter ATP-binding protein/permease [Clostridia bacterium]
MLKLQGITKNYVMGDTVVGALRGVDLEFRKNEFVSILGPSGCGKTTLLNIIGGLDKYTSGDLIINEKSTKKFTDKDWDAYRNHSIGFVFQSYNLIPHQTVLSNVELALTLSGVSKEERRKRATEVLEKVGLGDQLNKKPNQMSGGQMQRVAIARALVNDPDILLADEPTGALDSETSVQIMEILKEISKEKLIIMVTHNPELAETYSSRIIRLLDGAVIDDSNPYTKENEAAPVEAALPEQHQKKAKKKKSMSFFTALLLSLNNLLTKKGRTFLTAFAGSIGIIGIALILSVSSGVNAYITSIEESTMSSYPLQIQKATMDTNTLLSSLMSQNNVNQDRDPNKVYSSDIMVSMMEAISKGYTENNLAKFKEYLDNKDNGFDDLTTDIKYSYSANLNTYSIHSYEENGKTYIDYRKNISNMAELFAEIGLGGSSGSGSQMGGASMMGGGNAWAELVGDSEYIQSQYDLVHGKYPTKPNEIVIIVDENNQVTDYILYTLGIRDIQEVKDYIKAAQEAQLKGEECTYKIPSTSYTFDEICGYRFKALLDSDYYKLVETKNPITGEVIKQTIVERTEDELKPLLDNAVELEIVGIITPAEDSVSTVSIGCLGYLPSLMPSLIEKVNESDVVKAQFANTEVDLFTGKSFEPEYYEAKDVPMLRMMLSAFLDPSVVAGMSDQQVLDLANRALETEASYEGNLQKLGYVDFSNPNMISIYPKDFECKERIVELINEYNGKQEENDKITYTDTVALLMSSVTTIINAISYVLIAFVAISLVVSSIMIGIITYISVLERTKEIGILRAIGASKRDVSRVFNAETLIVGFTAGLLGILVTLIFNVIINVILFSLTGLATLKATLPVLGAIILVIISMGLTLIAGLIPSRVAAKKDPVIALRTE